MMLASIVGVLTSMPVKVGLLCAAFGLGVGYAITERHRSRWLAGSMHACSALLAFIAVASFLAVGPRPWHRSFLNEHDTYHYYFGAKYSAELGYDGLYRCTLLALDELSPQYHRRVATLRSMAHYRHIDKNYYLAGRRDRCHERFSPERWDQFKADVLTYQKNYSPNWQGYLHDKGYNPTPAWTIVGRFVAQRIPIEPWQRFNGIGIIDLLALLAAFGLAFAVFGWQKAVIALVFSCGCFALTLTFIRGSVLRLDWLAALVAAVAMLGAKRYAVCGVLIGYATMVRVFPALFLLGPIVLGTVSMVRNRRIPKPTAALVLAFTLTCGLLLGASAALTGQRDGWRSWATKISLHNADISTMRLGLGPLLMYRGEMAERDIAGPDGRGSFRNYFVPHKQAVVASMRPFHIAIAVLVLGLLVVGLVRKPHSDLEALGLSLPVVFVLVSPTFYYYCLLIPLVLASVASCSRQSTRLIVLGLFCAAEISLHLLHSFVRFEYGSYSLMSIALAVVSAATVAVTLRPQAQKGSV